MPTLSLTIRARSAYSSFLHISLRRSQDLLTSVSPRFDSSVGRGDFQTEIGVGKVIKGILKPQKVLETLELTRTRLG